jgi:hypothetical protein
MLWVRTLLRPGVLDALNVMKFVSDLRQVGGFLQVLLLRILPTIITDSQFNWNIVESGAKQHKTKPLALQEGNIVIVMGTDYIGSCKFNYHTITVTMAHL